MKSQICLLLLALTSVGCERNSSASSTSQLTVDREGVYSVRTKEDLTIVNIINDGHSIKLKIPADDPVGDVFVTKSANSRTIKSVTVSKLIGSSLKTITIDESGNVTETIKKLD